MIENPTKEQVSNTVNQAGEWIAALEAGTFKGKDATPIAKLIAFLAAEKKLAEERLVAMAPAPEFGKSGEVKQ